MILRFLLIGLLCCSQSLYARTVKVACVGNSVTYGYLLENRERNSYPAQLACLLGESYEVRNFGKSGATLLNRGHRPYMKQQEFREAVQFRPDIAVIHLGLNDTDPRDWPNFRDDFTADYLQLIDTFRRVNPACKIWICRMSPIAHRHPRFKAGTRDWYAQIQEAIGQVARVGGTGLIDLQQALYERPDLLPDALHPTAEGAGIIAATVYSAITGKYGGLRLPALYGDRMVLQRDKKLRFEGVADAGEKVKVKIGRYTGSGIAGANGRWEISLGPLPAGGPHVLKISTSRKSYEFKNVLVGEVWVCSGQSNMVFPVKQSAGAIQTLSEAVNDRIRLYRMKPIAYTDALSWDSLTLARINRLEYFQPAGWEEADSAAVAEFSAVGYYFGKMLADSLQLPVGLICNAVGGAPAEAYIDRRTLEYDPVLVDVLYDWTQNDMLQDWVRERALLNLKQAVSKLQRHPYEPAYLYETAVRPLVGFPIRGIVWYQGESNTHYVELYERVFPALIESWRRAWQEELPFYYVQLSGMGRPSWPRFRDSQRRLLANIGNAGMCVSSDLGDSTDVHPVHKREIGERLGRWALNKNYGYRELVPSGPLFQQAEFGEDAVYITFEYGQGLRSADGKPLRTFEIAGEDGLYVPARAVIEGNRLKVSCPGVIPKGVRYGWKPYSRGNLVNGEGLPASTFQSVYNEF